MFLKIFRSLFGASNRPGRDDDRYLGDQLIYEPVDLIHIQKQEPQDKMSYCEAVEKAGTPDLNQEQIEQIAREQQRHWVPAVTTKANAPLSKFEGEDTLSFIEKDINDPMSMTHAPGFIGFWDYDGDD